MPARASDTSCERSRRLRRPEARELTRRCPSRAASILRMQVLKAPRARVPFEIRAAHGSEPRRGPRPLGLARVDAFQLTRPRRGRPGPPESAAALGRSSERVQKTLRQTCPFQKERAQCAFKVSMIHVQCKSHYVSHFAAFFIVTGAEVSVGTNCSWFVTCVVLGVAASARAEARSGGTPRLPAACGA